MNRRKFSFFVSALLITALSACNLPGGTPDVTATPDFAQTLTALANQGAQPSPNLQETATPEFTATAGPTSTPSVPQVTVSTNTNCRVGPGVVYDLIDALVIGQTGEVVGKNSGVPNYWVIKRPSGSGTCWLWGEYATVSGNTANLPEYPVPPTPTPSATPTPTATATLAPPVAVENVTVAKVCNPTVPAPFDLTYVYSGNLTWQDKSNNEDGFNIYFNGGFIAALPANSTNFVLPAMPLPKNAPAKWGVEAFNAAGKAGVKDFTFSCP